jgi:hypothetical protein
MVWIMVVSEFDDGDGGRLLHCGNAKICNAVPKPRPACLFAAM